MYFGALLTGRLGGKEAWLTLGSFGNFGLEIQTWESTSALMSKSDNQLVEI